VPHFVPTYAIEVTSTEGPRRFTFGADCSPTDALVDFAHDTDLLVVEATLPRPERTGIRGHLTPGEAGEHGRAAGARRLVLTHVSDELGERWAREEAERTFGASVEVAREGAVYVV
jgi:ribonuclease BN (tRNA processing enzyme)